MRSILVIGIGAGDPEYVTVQAVNALNRASVFFVVDKGEEKSGLLTLRQEICRRYIADQSGYRFVEIPEQPRDRGAPATGPRSRTGTSGARSPSSRRSPGNCRRTAAARSWSGAIRPSTTARCASSTASATAGWSTSTIR